MEGLETEVRYWLRGIYRKIGIDIPRDNGELEKFICEDVEASADAENYHTGDFAIAFRRYLEYIGDNIQ